MTIAVCARTRASAGVSAVHSIKRQLRADRAHYPRNPLPDAGVHGFTVKTQAIPGTRREYARVAFDRMERLQDHFQLSILKLNELPADLHIGRRSRKFEDIFAVLT